MRIIIKRVATVVAVLPILVGLSTAVVMAAQNSTNSSSNGSGNGFRISPVRSELTIEKGKSAQITVTIENPTDIKTPAKGVVNDFVSSDKEDGEARLILDDNAPAPKNSFKKLVQPIGDIELGPHEKKDVVVTIGVSEDANAGGYYGAIRFVPTVTNNAGNVGLTASVGTIVLVRVPGNLTERLDLLQISAAQGDKLTSYFSSGDVNVIVRLKNSGDIHVKPFGRVQVKNMFGKVVKDYELNNVEPRANILPDSTRKFVDAIPKPSGGWLGRYTIEANLGYNQGGGQLIYAKTSFWYVPTWAVLVLLLIVVVIAAAVYWFLKGRDKKRQHKVTKKHTKRG